MDARAHGRQARVAAAAVGDRAGRAVRGAARRARRVGRRVTADAGRRAAHLRPDGSAEQPAGHPAERSGAAAQSPAATPAADRPADRPADASERARGLVETLSGKQIVGHVRVDAGDPPVVVALCLNDRPVTEVEAVPPVQSGSSTPGGHGRGSRTFRFRLADIWRYCGPDDLLTVQVDGRPLPIAGRRGAAYRPRNRGSETRAELFRRLEAGEVFASNGRLGLARTQDLEWQDAVLGLFDRVRAALQDIAGYEAFYIYGSLLGAVRSGTFIGHDTDFDAAYVSRHTDGPAVGRELADIAIALSRRGFHVESRVVCLHIYDAESRAERIDLFQLWFDAAGTLQFPWGVAGTTPFVRAQWDGVEEIDFAGRRGIVPRNAEALVETIYGPHWRIPNPGFDWVRDRTGTSAGGRIPQDLGSRANWEDYWTHHGFAAPSAFAEVVGARADLPRVVVDLGCGDGRDSEFFVRAGRVVLGADRSSAALDRARRRVAELPDEPDAGRARFVELDLADAAAVRDLLGRARSAPDDTLVVYARFLVHAVPEQTYATVLEAVAATARPGDLIALEFRTAEDEDRPKAHALGYRRFPQGAQVVKELEERYGFVSVVVDEGTGLAPFEEEDPYVQRVIARRGDAAAPDALERVALVLEAQTPVRLVDVTGTAIDAEPATAAYDSAAADLDAAAGELRAVAFALIQAGMRVAWRTDHLRVTTVDEVVRVSPRHPDGAVQPRADIVEEIYWADFYAHTEYGTGSTFFDAVVALDGVPQYVVDLGCGDGRDSYAFAASGRDVLGIDRSHIGVAHATRKAAQLGHADLARFRAGDVGDADALRAALADQVQRAGSEPVLFYARFFLHSIPAEVQETLLTVVSELARPGDWFAAEFRTDKDEAQEKVHREHYRRFQNGPEFGRRLHEVFGFEPFHTDEGRGLSPYKGEDPELYRVVAVRR